MNYSKIYARFERGVAAAVLVGMVAVILLAVISFLMRVVQVTFGLPGDLEYGVFQTLFDRVLAAIIALEIAHSIREMVAGRHGAAQLRTVVVIGMLAVVRKLVVLEIESTSGMFLAGLAAVVLALGITFAIVTVWGGTRTPPPAPGAED
jgi:uncharacterized membrane protein (DUF373 family)